MSKKPKDRRVVAIGDMHCGHHAGLTPRSWWMPKSESGDTWRDAVREIQVATWSWYAKMARQIQDEQRIDTLIINGDLIDGGGGRSGGTELITTDRFEQCAIASRCLEEWDAENYAFTFGTAYHTGDHEDFEELIAAKLRRKGKKVSISSHEWPKVNDLVFDCKHHLGSSSVPHGRTGAINRDRLWNELWHIRGDRQPLADITLRSHVHYHVYAGDPWWLGMTLPPLQSVGTKFGARRCSGIVDHGLVVFDTLPDKVYSWTPYISQLDAHKAKVTDFDK